MDSSSLTVASNAMDKIVALCKRRGFIYPGSEIYGGLANTYDYGPLGVALKNNIKKAWWEKFVQRRSDVYGLDGSVLLNPNVWKASGHVDSFLDYLVECKTCHRRFHIDHIEGFVNKGDHFEIKELPKCPSGEDHILSLDMYTKKPGRMKEVKPRKFNGMFRTFIGATEDSESVAYLRPETAQAIFINFKNIIDSFSPKIPFGIAQVGKAFRNEITTGNFIFRTLEFEQMEIEYFIRENEWQKIFKMWQDEMLDWALSVGIKKDNLRFREHDEKERSHYSKKTVDLEYNFSTGFKEIYGLAYRGDFDLSNHSKNSGVDLKFMDLETQEKFFPHVVEPSFGIERTILPILLDAYTQEEKRIVLKLNPKLAPYKVAVFPLLHNKPELVSLAKKVYTELKKDYVVAFDDRGNIGKRYFAQDEIGTPFCITVDFESLENETITIRDRDTMRQERIKIPEVQSYIDKKLS